MAEPSRRSGGVSLIPSRVAGRYEPLAKIASGGMATVYLARSSTGVGVGKLVALKCVHPHMADQAEFVNMFLDEARIATRVDHPNVATVFDAGQDEGTHYLAMEYLHGEPVTALIRAWDLEPAARPDGFCELAARVIADAAMGLHAAHELRGADGELLNLVHRDISPQNLFVTYDGSVKVVDFGIAKASGRLHETTTGIVKGKVAYMSPEQLHAEPLDRRTDVWALGVTLWEALTCRRLFKRADQIKTLNAVLESVIDAPSEHEPRVPAALDRIVLKALARDPSDRHASARALAGELNAFIASRGSHVGMAELADLMRVMFADEKAEKDAWVARAREGRYTLPPDAPSEPPVEPTVSEVRPTRVTTTEPIELPVRRTGRWVALTGLALLLAGVGLGAYAWTRDGGAGAVTSSELEVAPAAVGQPSLPSGADAPPLEPAANAATPSGEPPSEAIPSDPAAPDRAPSETPPDAPRRDRPASERASPRRGRGGAATREVVATPAPSPAPPPAQGRRDIRIVHPGGGWAQQRLDGRTGQNTPAQIPDVSVGRHVLELRPYGVGPWQRHPIDVPVGGAPWIVRVPLPDAPPAR